MPWSWRFDLSTIFNRSVDSRWTYSFQEQESIQQGQRKECEELKSKLKAVHQANAALEMRLNKCLDDLECLRKNFRTAKCAEKDLQMSLQHERTFYENQLKVNQKQRNDLIVALKKHMLLIGNLKQQNACLTQAKCTQMSEMEFLKILDWNNSSNSTTKWRRCQKTNAFKSYDAILAWISSHYANFCEMWAFFQSQILKIEAQMKRKKNITQFQSTGRVFAKPANRKIKMHRERWQIFDLKLKTSTPTRLNSISAIRRAVAVLRSPTETRSQSHKRTRLSKMGCWLQSWLWYTHMDAVWCDWMI